MKRPPTRPFSRLKLQESQCKPVRRDKASRVLRIRAYCLSILAAFSVKFSAAGDSCSLTVVTDEIADLGDLMKETKRLADVAGRLWNVQAAFNV